MQDTLIINERTKPIICQDPGVTFTFNQQSDKSENPYRGEGDFERINSLLILSLNNLSIRMLSQYSTLNLYWQYTVYHQVNDMSASWSIGVRHPFTPNLLPSTINSTIDSKDSLILIVHD